MALTNQPYLPLYVDDWMNNNKLKQCSAGAHGILIDIMCVMHKEDNYGKITLKERFKIHENEVKNFAEMLAKLLPFFSPEIEKYLAELLSENVLKIKGDSLICQRMVKDASLSEKRAKSGKKGGAKFALDFARAKTKANHKAKEEQNTVNEIVNENTVLVFNPKEVSEKLKVQEFETKRGLMSVYKISENEYQQAVDMFCLDEENCREVFPEVIRHFRNWVKNNIANIRKTLKPLPTSTGKKFEPTEADFEKYKK